MPDDTDITITITTDEAAAIISVLRRSGVRRMRELADKIDKAAGATAAHDAGRTEADEDVAAGRGTIHNSAEDMFAYLDSADDGTPEAEDE